MNKIKLIKASRFDKMDYPKAFANLRIGRNEMILSEKDLKYLQIRITKLLCQK